MARTRANTSGGVRRIHPVTGLLRLRIDGFGDCSLPMWVLTQTLRWRRFCGVWTTYGGTYSGTANVIASQYACPLFSITRSNLASAIYRDRTSARLPPYSTVQAQLMLFWLQFPSLP